MGKFKGMACLLLSFFLSSLLRTCLSWRTRTASLCWRRWWAPPLHHTAPQARVPSSIDHRGAWRMWLACWWDSQSSWSLSSPAPYPPPPPGEADPWSPSSFNKRQTITNLVLRFPVFDLPPALLPLSLSHHHQNTHSHRSDRQPACLPANPKTQPDGLLPSPRHPSSLIFYNRIIIVSQQPQLWPHLLLHLLDDDDNNNNYHPLHPPPLLSLLLRKQQQQEEEEEEEEDPQ